MPLISNGGFPLRGNPQMRHLFELEYLGQSVHIQLRFRNIWINSLTAVLLRAPTLAAVCYQEFRHNP